MLSASLFPRSAVESGGMSFGDTSLSLCLTFERWPPPECRFIGFIYVCKLAPLIFFGQALFLAEWILFFWYRYEWIFLKKIVNRKLIEKDLLALFVNINFLFSLSFGYDPAV